MARSEIPMVINLRQNKTPLSYLLAPEDDGSTGGGESGGGDNGGGENGGGNETISSSGGNG